MRLGIVRIDPQRDPVLRDGAVQVTFGFKCISEVRVCFEEIGLDPQRGGIPRLRLLNGPPQQGHCHAPSVPLLFLHCQQS
jgi:hypothetical protein